LYRNVQKQDLTPSIVFSLLSCQIFLFNNYKYDLDLDLKAGKADRSRKDDNEDIKDNLGIPQVDLFDMFQVNRVKIMNWLVDPKNVDEKNMVCKTAFVLLFFFCFCLILIFFFLHFLAVCGI
jgi:hypothetical protein